MDAKQKLMSLMDRRRKKQTKLQKDGEHLSKITEARNLFLKSQNITPELYNEHDVYMTVIQKRFYELCKWPQLTAREFVNVNILNGNSPKELFLIRKKDEKKALDFHRALTAEYTSIQLSMVYCMKAGLICVANTSKGWQRCRILKLHDNSTSDALLFDIGIIERVNWCNLRIIEEQFAQNKPMATRCSLINVLTAQPIERFSLQHHQHFQQILNEQNDFYMFVNRANFMSSDIYLYYKMDGEFHCINNIFPSQTLSDDSSIEEDATSEANIDKDSSTNSKSKSKSEELEPESVHEDSIQIERSSVETERSSESLENVKEQRQASPDQLLESCKISKPWKVVVKHVVGIDEIYVCFVKYADALNRLRFDVQTYVEMESPSTNDAWKIGDYCLAVDPADGSGEWFRGKVVGKQASDICMVFLRDIGKTIECKASSLKVISRELQLVRDFTWKVKLTSIKMMKSCTQTVMNELLCDMIDTYEEMAITAVGDNNGNDWGVILWGIKKVFDALLPERIEYININESLVQNGVATTKASFHGITNICDMVNPSQRDLVETPKTVGKNYDDMRLSCLENSHLLPLFEFQKYKAVTDEPKAVEFWLPSERIYEKKFVAFPMYVSQKLIIYVLEASRKTVSDEIKEILEQKYRRNLLERKDSVEWKKEDACFARYDGDDRFYRGTIRRVNFAKNTCVVRFIDYGNCETCSLDDLRKATMFGDIPVLTRQYQLHNIQSTAPDGLWPEPVRNFCNNLIVERHCDLIVVDDERYNGAGATPEMENCRLDLLTKHKDLATALISRGFAKLIHEDNSERISF